MAVESTEALFIVATCLYYLYLLSKQLPKLFLIVGIHVAAVGIAGKNVFGGVKEGAAVHAG